MYLCKRNRVIDTESMFGISKHRSLGLADENYYIEECINNKALLYSTGNYTQHPVTNHSENECEKEGTSA